MNQPNNFEEIILYYDNHLLVVCKPAGLLSQGDRSNDDDLLSAGKRYLKRRFDKPGRVYLGLVHRLDRPVSGVMVLARTSKAAARLSSQFRDREVEKKYVALVEGRIDAIGKRSTHLKRIRSGVTAAIPGSPGARYSELSWVTIGPSALGTLVSITLVTGRKHQIRHQLSELGHPIIGDLRYGSQTRFSGRAIALHCYSLAIDHPTKKRRMIWTAVPPASWGKDGVVVAEWMGTP